MFGSETALQLGICGVDDRRDICQRGDISFPAGDAKRVAIWSLGFDYHVGTDGGC
jgi:hypothetical protein